MKTNTLIVALVWTTIVSAAAFAQSVSPLINYQGQLMGANGQPLPTADYELRFSIYDAVSGGNPIWGPQVFNGQSGPGYGPKIPVVQGYFNVMLGPVDINGKSLLEAFNGANRHIEITISNRSPIAPRQQILSAPYAIRAENAKHLDGRPAGDFVAKAGDTMTGSLRLPANGLNVGNDQLVVANGKVGVGTAAPVSSLDVRGNSVRVIGVNPAIMFAPEGSSDYGMLGVATLDGGVFSGSRPNDAGLAAPSSGNLLFGMNYMERMRITTNGNVGIGTTSPEAKLDVQGSANVAGIMTAAGLAGAFKIQTTNIADGAISQAKMAPREIGSNVGVGGVAMSDSVSFSTSSGVPVDVPSLSVRIATTGRPIFLGLIGDGSGMTSSVGTDHTPQAGPTFQDGTLKLNRNGVEIVRTSRSINAVHWQGGPSGSFWHLDVPPAGTHIYQIQAFFYGQGLFNISRVKLIAFEL